MPHGTAVKPDRVGSQRIRRFELIGLARLYDSNVAIKHAIVFQVRIQLQHGYGFTRRRIQGPKGPVGGQSIARAGYKINNMALRIPNGFVIANRSRRTAHDTLQQGGRFLPPGHVLKAYQQAIPVPGYRYLEPELLSG